MTSQYLRSTFSSLREYLTPITHTSTFATTGEITPEEFVKAGDYLVYRFPTWQWSPAEPSKAKDFLPENKQFLVTRHVPCYVRAADYELVEEKYEEELKRSHSNSSSSNNNNNNNNNNNADIRNNTNNSNGETGHDRLSDEEWTSPIEHSHTHVKINDGDVNETEERSIKEVSDDDDIQDIDELIDENAEDVEFIDNKRTKISNSSTSKKRSYDLYITYSTSYRVPKMYLVGFDSNSVPLTPEEMFEDIASDYRHKTVTIEKAPFLNNTTAVSIHPCKHANVMKALMKRASASAKEKSHRKETEKLMRKFSNLGQREHDKHKDNENDNDNNENKKDKEDGDWEDLKTEDLDNNDNNDNNEIDGGIRVDQYLVVFLKFISSVIPGIEHDYTMEAL